MPRIPFSFASFARSPKAPVTRSVSLAAFLASPTAAKNMASTPPELPTYKIRPYKPTDPDGPFPYTKSDLTPMDPSLDTVFYSQPRFVTHIDDNAVIALKQYYDAFLPNPTSSGLSLDSSRAPRPVRILDVCSSWVSHYPPRIAKAAALANPSPSPTSPRPATITADAPDTASQQAATPSAIIECYGTGLNQAELAANPTLNPTASGRARDGESVAERRWWVQDLNAKPELQLPDVLKSRSESGGSNPREMLDATTLVVSIDYLTSPVQVLESIRSHTVSGGKIHLAISNRCFPTKAVSRWLKVSEEERVEMVGDYLWWSGWRDIEIVEVVEKQDGWVAWKDPLWVVRGRKIGESR